MNKKNQKGFTLVELIVVIAIVAILAAVGIVGYSQFIKNARNSKAKAELDQVVNVLYAEAIVDGIYVDSAGTNVVSATTENAVKVVSVANGKLVIGIHGDEDALTGALTKTQLETLIKKYADDFTGEFILHKDKLIYKVGDGEGETVVTTHSSQPESGDDVASYKKQP